MLHLSDWEHLRGWCFMPCPKRLQAGIKITANFASGRRLNAALELGNKLLLGPGTFATRRLENAEVGRLAAQLAQLPAAKVATIIPTCRRPILLQRAVRSALAQTVHDQVVLVVDDGGGLPCLPTDARLYPVSLSANIGVLGVVRNIGIRLTSSQYVAFLDDDNEWLPNHLEVTLNALNAEPVQSSPGLVYTALRRLLPSGQQLDSLGVPFDRRLLAQRSYIDSNAMVIRRFPGLHFSRIRRPMRVRPREDWELAYRLSRSVRTVYVDEPTVLYHINPDSFYINWSGKLGLVEERSSAMHERLQ
jgi:hypothetical protein